MRRSFQLLGAVALVTIGLVASWRALGPGEAPLDPPVPSYTADADPDAMRLLERGLAAVREAPRDSSRRADLGMMYQANAMLERARTCYEQAIALDATNGVAWYFLALVHRHLGEMEPALAALRQAVAGDAHAAAFARLGDWCLDMDDVAEAEAAYRGALEVDPAWVPARVGLARAALARGAPEEARRILDALLARRPDPGAQALRVLAAAARRTGDTATARAMTERSRSATAQWPDPVNKLLDQYRIGVPVELERARQLVSRGRIDEALAGLRRLEARFPDSGAVPNGIGIVLAQAGRLDEALVAFERALAKHEPFAEAHYNWAMIAVTLADQRGDPVPSAALEHVRRALEVNAEYQPAMVLAEQLEARAAAAPLPPVGPALPGASEGRGQGG